MKKSINFMLLPILIFFFACSDAKKETTENPVVAEKDYYQIMMDAFNGTASLPADFAALLDDSFPPRGLPPLMSFASMDTNLLKLWLFATTISDNGFAIIKPGMKGKTKYTVPGTNIEMEMEVENFLMNVGIHTKAIFAVLDDDPNSLIRGILPDNQIININVEGTNYEITREWIQKNSYFSAYTLLAKARVIDVVVQEGSYPIPSSYDVAQFEILTYDANGDFKVRYEKPSELLHAISGLTSDNPNLTYQIKMSVAIPADFDGDGNFTGTLYLPYSLFGKADISFPMLTNYVSYTTSFITPKTSLDEYCHFIDPTVESGTPDPDALFNQTDPNPTWWLPTLPMPYVNGLSEPTRTLIKSLLFIDEGERGFDVDWWRDLEILTEVPGLGLSDVGMFASYSGVIGEGDNTYDLTIFNKNGVMDSPENRAVFFDRMFRMNGFRLTDNGNFLLGHEPYPSAGLMDSPKIDVDAQGNITFGGKYDGPTRLVGVQGLADSIEAPLKIFFYLNGLVPSGTSYDSLGLNDGFARYIRNVKAFLPCELAPNGWEEVNMPQLLQYIATKWDRIPFYADQFVNPNAPTVPEFGAFIAKLGTGTAFGKFPYIDRGEVVPAPFIIRADVEVPEKGTTYEGLEMLMSAWGGAYNTNFYKGALSQ